MATKTAMLREKFGLSTNHSPQQGSIVLDPEPPANNFHASTIVVATSKPCPQTPAKQVGLQRETPKLHRQTQTEQGTRGLVSPDSIFLKSPLQYSTPGEKKPDSNENKTQRDVPRLLRDALHLIRQAADLQPNLNTLVREVEKAQKAPSTYKPSGKQESYRDALLKDIKPKSQTPLTTPQNTLILKVEKLDVFDPQQVRDKINRALGSKKVAAIRKSTKSNLVIKTTPNTAPRDVQKALSQVGKAIGTKIISAEEPRE
ncbi:hypothetical protein F5Y03DRAFT_364966, partial [Xylaria venustula]